MNRPILLILFLLTALLSLAQNNDNCDPSPSLTIDQPEGAAPWTNLDLNNNPCQFQFAIVTDRTGGHRPGVFMDGVRKLNLVQPEFVLSVGDLIEGYTENLTELNRQWDQFDGFVSQLDMPFFYIPGNHDITNPVMEELWEKRLGPTYYHFLYKDVLFLCLNSEDQIRGSNRGTISDEQYEYIKKVLAENTEAKWTLVFMHQPLWLLDDTKRWKDVEQLLSTRKHTVFVGHHHDYAKYERNNGKYFMLATTGGGSSLRGPQLGEFDHVVWVTMTEDGPIIANLELSGIWDENVYTQKTKDFVAEVVKKEIVRIEPFYSTEGTFTAGELRMKVTNDENIPMTVKLKEGFSWDLRLETDKNEIVVPPNSVEFVPLYISSKRNKSRSLNSIRPVQLSADVYFESDVAPKVGIPYSYYVAPLPKLNLLPVDKPVSVNGQLDEWESLPYEFGAEEKEDISAQFNFAYDDNSLYLAAKVTDDDIQIDTSATAWQQDFIGFIVNGDPMGLSVMRTGRGWYRNSLPANITPSTDKLPSSSYFNTRWPDNVQIICKAMEGGYAMEAAIPLQYIKDLQGEDWQNVRLNMVLQDKDQGEEDTPRYFFQPDWRGKENCVGSGMLFKQDKQGR